MVAGKRSLVCSLRLFVAESKAAFKSRTLQEVEAYDFINLEIKAEAKLYWWKRKQIHCILHLWFQRQFRLSVVQSALEILTVQWRLNIANVD